MTTPKVPAADQTLRILSLLATSRGPIPASIIAAQLELPRSTVYHLLATLQDHGFVMHLPDERRYGLGIAAFELSSAYTRQEPLARLGRPLLVSLVDRSGFSGHLAVQHGRDVLYIVEERAKGAPSLITDVNVRLPAQLTASGRAILAYLPKAQLRALYPNHSAFVHGHEPGGETEHAEQAAIASGLAGGGAREVAIDRYSKLREVLDATTTRGFALERGSVTRGFSSVAVPVFDHRDWPIAAIAITFRDEEVAERDLAALADEAREAAATLSTRIHGGRGVAI